jgi:hypothetical protein
MTFQRASDSVADIIRQGHGGIGIGFSTPSFLGRDPLAPNIVSHRVLCMYEYEVPIGK